MVDVNEEASDVREYGSVIVDSQEAYSAVPCDRDGDGSREMYERMSEQREDKRLNPRSGQLRRLHLLCLMSNISVLRYTVVK